MDNQYKTLYFWSRLFIFRKSVTIKFQTLYSKQYPLINNNMNMYKNIVLLLLVATVYTEIITQLTCSPGFVLVNTYCVQGDANSVGLTASNDPCSYFDDNGVCVSQNNANAQASGNDVLTSNAPSSNPFPQTFVPNVGSSSSPQNPQNSAASLNQLFTFYGPQSPQFSAQGGSTGSFPSGLAAAAANSGNVPPASLISTDNPAFQTAPSSNQNTQFGSPTSNNQNIPVMVKSGPTQTSSQQVPSYTTTKSGALVPQLSQLLFRGGNTPSISTNNINTNPASRTSSSTPTAQITNTNQNFSGTSSSSSTQGGNTFSDVNSNSVSTLSSSLPSQNKDINPFSYCAKFNPITLQCEQCAKGHRVNPKFNKTNPNQAPYCLILDPLCKTYTTDLSKCATCYTGYDVFNSTCIISRNTLPNCQTANANKTACVKCYKGFYVEATSKQCKARNPQCATYTSNTSNECATCYVGYRVVKGDCVAIQTIIANISNTNNNNANPNTPSIFYFQGTPGLVTSSLDAAVPAGDTIDLNCAKYTNGVCMQCNFRTYFKNKVCQPVSDECQTFNQNTGSCTSCFKGFELQSNGACVKGNDLCMSRNTSTGACTACYLGYILGADGKCK